MLLDNIAFYTRFEKKNLISLVLKVFSYNAVMVIVVRLSVWTRSKVAEDDIISLVTTILRAFGDCWLG